MRHPAFADEQWSQAVVDYANYDLTGAPPTMRASASLEAVRQDSVDLYGGGVVLAALFELTRLRKPVVLLTIREVPDVNHYTIIFGAVGAKAVARELRLLLGPFDGYS